jgi:hypothetical protein
VDLQESTDVYERLLHYDEVKEMQFRLTINVFRGVEYLSIRKYYLTFDEEWMPTREGVSMPLDFNNSRELFSGLVEILSLAESKDILEKQFKEQLDSIYLT